MTLQLRGVATLACEIRQLELKGSLQLHRASQREAPLEGGGDERVLVP